jgi:RNA polymerase sigma factor (sigma-70 family)
MEIVRKALDMLSEKDRTVLLLWDAGFSYEEIAEQTNLSKGAIGTTLARARARLVEAHGRLEGRDAASG